MPNQRKKGKTCRAFWFTEEELAELAKGKEIYEIELSRKTGSRVEITNTDYIKYLIRMKARKEGIK